MNLWLFFFSQMSLSCRANCAAGGTALSALKALENYSHQSKLEHNGGREEDSGEIISPGSSALKEWRLKMLATHQRYDGGQWWIPWSWDWDILQQPVPPSHPQNIHSILPVTLSSDIQLLVSPPLLSIIHQSKRPSHPVISLHSISISSCEWSLPINGVVGGGGGGEAKAIYCSIQCFLIMCQGTYIWILPYASICGCVENEGKKAKVRLWYLKTGASAMTP